jgi:hypothetical protein
MKAILPVTSLVLVLLAFAMPLFAQNPNLAIRIETGTGVSEYCVKGSLMNLTSVIMLNETGSPRMLASKAQ